MQDLNIMSKIRPLLGGIQQLRGQEGGEGGSAKSPHLSTQGAGGGVSGCPRGQKFEKKVQKNHDK